MGNPESQAAVIDRPPNRKRKWWTSQSFKDHVSGYLYVSPFFIAFLIFGLFPIVYTFYISMFSWKAIGAHEFVGLRNYVSLLTDDPKFWRSVMNTFTIWVMSTVPQLFLALVLATILNRRLKLKGLFRLGVFIPNITSLAAVAIIFSGIFSRQYGIINWILSWFGVDKIDWVGGYWTAQIGVAVMVLWRWTGYNAIIYLAALQTVPNDLYEAATIDGANKTQQFFNITIPMIRPVIIFTILVSTIGGMQVFVEPLLFTNSYDGGAANQVMTMMLYMYSNGFRDYNFGYAAAVSWMTFLIIVLFSMVNFLISRKISSAN